MNFFRLMLLFITCLPTCSAYTGLSMQEIPVKTLSAEIVPHSLLISPDAKRMAWFIHGNENGKKTVQLVLDGKPGPSYDDAISSDKSVNCLCFSPDSRRVAYIAQRDQRWIPIVDGIEGTPREEIWDLQFSKNSKHTLYRVWDNEKVFFVYDEKLYQHLERYREVILSGDGRRVGYTGRLKRKFFAGFAGPGAKEYSGGFRVAFSPDSSKLAFAISSKKKEHVVLNGTPGKSYDYVDALSFSPNSKHFAYFARSKTAAYMVLDGVEKPVKLKEVVQILFSPNSARTVLLSATKTKDCLWVDGKVSKEYEGIENITFSPNSRHIASIASRPAGSMILKDGVEGKLYSNIAQLSFSPDSKHVAYSAMHNGKWLVVQDGIESAPYDEVVDIRYTPTGSLQAYVINKNQLVKLSR